MRYTFHGGGRCDGALYRAVMPGPLPSGSAGQPWSAHALAMRASAPGSVTRAASPSMTKSASRLVVSQFIQPNDENAFWRKAQAAGIPINEVLKVPASEATPGGYEVSDTNAAKLDAVPDDD
jgi:hypothetical protein